MTEIYRYKAQEDIVEVLDSQGHVIDHYKPSPGEKWSFLKLAEMKATLKLAGKVSTVTRGLVGGTDFSTGRNIPSCSIAEVGEIANAVRSALDEYDRRIMEQLHNRS